MKVECENCRKRKFQIEFEMKVIEAKKHYDYWKNQRKFWVQQWKDTINKGKINLEIAIENKILELDNKFGEAIERIYKVN